MPARRPTTLLAERTHRCLYVVVAPGGGAMPCHAASPIPGSAFETVREHDLAWIRKQSERVDAFRGGAPEARVYCAMPAAHALAR